jgi:hypothetical protein
MIPSYTYNRYSLDFCFYGAASTDSCIGQGVAEAAPQKFNEVSRETEKEHIWR